MTTPAIETIGLTKHYPGVAALSDLSLAVPAGSIYGFLGPNGSGKSTTLKLLAGLIRPTSGSASVFGVPLSAGAAYRSEVGYLAQDPRFYDWMTGREILKFVAALGARTTSTDAEIDTVLARVGLRDAADRATKTYSGGMRASVSGSPRHWSRTRASYSSTSRRAPSTPSAVARSWTCSASCAAR